MHFGRVDNNELSGIDFTLPVDPGMTTETLASSKREGQLKVYVGATTWATKEFLGVIYPLLTPENNFLELYTQQFNTIEFGTTFYSTPIADKVKDWKDKALKNPGFKFCPKFPQGISNIRRFKNAEVPTKQFYESIRSFGQHLGPIFIQLPENFTFKDFEVLKSYLSELPTDLQLFLELRNEKWFANLEQREMLFNTLKKHSIGAVITDAPARRDAVHMHLPVPHAMIRFVATGLDDTELKRLDAWVSRLKSWSDQGLQSLWFFVHQQQLQTAPKSCEYFIKRVNEKLGLNVKPPVLLS